MVKRWNLNHPDKLVSVIQVSAPIFSGIADNVYLYPCAAGNSECAPIGF